MIVWTFACKIKSPRWQSPSWLSSVPPVSLCDSVSDVFYVQDSVFARVFCVWVYETVMHTSGMWLCECVRLAFRLLSLRSVTGTFSWRRSLKSLPRQLGVRVSVCLFMYAFVRVSAHLNPELQSPTTPSQHPLFNFLLLFFHSSVKTSRVRVDRGWLAKIADYSVCMSRSNICAFISIFFLYMWNSLKERRPLSLQ